jgi:hypothetical protein
MKSLTVLTVQNAENRNYNKKIVTDNALIFEVVLLQFLPIKVLNKWIGNLTQVTQCYFVEHYYIADRIE